MIPTLTRQSDNISPKNSRLANELLLACARTKIDESIKSEIKNLVRQDINWQYLTNLASRHGVAPLIYYNLNQICSENIYPNILASLLRFFQSNAHKNLFITAELLNVLNIFQANNIKAIPFKGATLATSAYGNLAFRQFCDLDILIEANNIPKATQLLVSQGYKLPEPLAETKEKPYLQDNRFQCSAQYQGSYDFINYQKNIVVELHWNLTNKSFSFPVTFQHLWQNQSFVLLSGLEIPQFSPEDLLIFLCMHSSKHCWSELKWICDVAEFINSHPDINWELVNKQARDWGCDLMINLGLLLVRNLLKTNLPDPIVQKIEKDRIAQSLAKEVEEKIFTTSFTEREKYIFIYRVREKIKDQLRYLLHILFVPTAKEWQFLPLPNNISFLYYFIRPFRLLFNFFIDNKCS